MSQNQKFLASLSSLPLPKQAAAKARIKWINTARPKQITPEGDWLTWLLLAGRGFGKTRTAAEDIADYSLWRPKQRIGVVAATSSDLFKTCFEGESGLLGVLPPECIVRYVSKPYPEIEIFNGTLIQGFSAEKPDRLRGPNFHRAWCDELAAWRYPEAWDMLMFALRLGDAPRVIVTTTPRPTPIIKELASADSTYITTGSTYENKENLAPTFVNYLEKKYEGTRLGRQELFAEILLDNPAALWSRDRIESLRVNEAPALRRIVVAIDPAVTSDEDSDETGISVAGIGEDGQGYVLLDATMKGTPDQWARRAVELYHFYAADRIIGEANNGGDMIETIIRTVDSSVSYKSVRASRGKIARAEPVSALYEQNRVHHVGMFAALEDQMCEWNPAISKKSPDRMDALVWAITELMAAPQYDGILQYYREQKDGVEKE